MIKMTILNSLKEMQQQIVKDLSKYSNLVLALTRLKQEIDTDIQNNDLSKQHSQLNKLDSFEVINNYKFWFRQIFCYMS
mgnify:CR=1 FL=1